MSWTEFWLALIKKNPKLVDPNLNTVEITKQNFEKLLKQAHDASVTHGKEQTPLFDEIFGKMK